MFRDIGPRMVSRNVRCSVAERVDTNGAVYAMYMAAKAGSFSRGAATEIRCTFQVLEPQLCGEIF